MRDGAQKYGTKITLALTRSIPIQFQNLGRQLALKLKQKTVQFTDHFNSIPVSSWKAILKPELPQNATCLQDLGMFIT